VFLVIDNYLYMYVYKSMLDLLIVHSICLYYRVPIYKSVFALVSFQDCINKHCVIDVCMSDQILAGN